MDAHRPARWDHPYRESGPADGRPVVFVHGFLVDDAPLVRRARAARRAGVPHLRADLAARRPPDRHEAGRRPVAAGDRPGGARRSSRRSTSPTWCWSAATPGERSASSCSTRTPRRIGRAGAHQLRRVRRLPAVPVQLALPARPAPGRGRARCSRRCARRSCATASSGSAGWSRRDADRRGEPGVGRRPTSPTPAYAATSRAFARGWTGEELADVGHLAPAFDRPVLLCWAPGRPVLQARPGAAARRARSRTRRWSSSPALAPSSRSTSRTGWPTRSCAGSGALHIGSTPCPSTR